MTTSKLSEAQSPEEYIGALEEPRRTQIQQLHDLIRKTVPELKPHMRSGMIGFGTYHTSTRPDARGIGS